MRKQSFIFVIVALSLIVLLPDTLAYDRYNSGCQNCHGAFTDGTSTKGSTFPSDNKHEMHRSSSSMNTECNLCHTSGDQRNPYIGSSSGTSNNVGLGCVGCHGRTEDGGNDGISNGYGAGLRQHHYNSGETSCTFCHTDANPTNYTPVGEDVTPPYYGTVDTLADMPCNADASANTNENWTVNGTEGTDNDGDGSYDMNDTDCSGPALTPAETTNLLVTAHDQSSRIVTIAYDNPWSCVDNNAFYSGLLSQVSSHTWSSNNCTVGNTGTYGMPYAEGSDSIFFVIVGYAGSLEGSYGRHTNGSGGERPQAGLCTQSQDLSRART
jgi:hypothetical protein